MQQKQSAIPLSNPIASSSIASTYENENVNDKGTFCFILCR